MATGRKNGAEHRGLRHRRRRCRFDLERAQRARTCRTSSAGRSPAQRRVLVTEADAPLPRRRGGRRATSLGWDHTFTSQAADFLTARRHRHASRRRRSPTGSPSSGCWRRSSRVRQGRAHASTYPSRTRRRNTLMGKRFTLFTGQWADLHPRGGRRAGGRLGLRRPRDRRLRRAPRRLALGRRRLRRRAARDPRAARPRAAGRSPTTSPARRSATTRSTSGTRRSCATRVWGDGDPEGVRTRAAEEMKLTARLAQRLGVDTVVGFTGSSIWQYVAMFPPVPAATDRGRLPGLRRPLEPDPRRVRRVRRAVRARGAPLRDRLRLLVDACARWRRSATARRSGSTGTPAT